MRFGLRELILLAILIGLPVASFFMVFKPQNREIEQAKQEISHKQQMLERLRAETARSADLKKQNERIAEAIKGIEARLPTNKEVDSIMRQVSELAVQTGLGPPQMKAAKTLSAAKYMEQPLELSTQGRFTDFHEFLKKLEELPRITRITDMKLKNQEKDGRMQADFTLSIYFLDEGTVKP